MTDSVSPGPVQEQIDVRLREALEIEHMELLNESYMHNVPAGSETHFKLVLVSSGFAGMMPVKRHQMVYRLLADELAGPVHALALHLFTPDEWQSRGETVEASPACRGGSAAESK